jgi:hypothetical protein
MKRYILILLLPLLFLSLSHGLEPVLIIPGTDFPHDIEQENAYFFFPFPLNLRESLITLSYRSEISCVLEMSGKGGYTHTLSLPPLENSNMSYTLEEILPFSFSSLYLRDIQGNPVPFKLKLTDKTSFVSFWPRADQSTILASPFDSKKDFHLYRWAEKEDILIFDFMSYEIQERYFKRLAFFIEKPGYRGTLMTNEEMEGLHGWNAHDYSSHGLASFFNLVQKEDFPINDEEKDFLKILLNRGILLYDGLSYLEGEGAVISISQESSRTLRQRFLTHETLHGIFFSDKDFQKEIREYWLAMPKDYREIWKTFMIYNFYDPSDEVLMYNELLGYILQLERKQVAGYFVWRFNRIIELHPDEKDSLEPIINELPKVMVQIYDNLESIVSRRYSYRNGYFNENL